MTEGETHPLVRRQAAAQATIDRFQGKPLAYGKDDCARMVAFCLKRLGVKVSLLKAGTYSTATGASRTLKRLGFATLADAVDALGLPRIAPAKCVLGDILALPTETGEVALYVAVGNGRAFGVIEDSFAVGQPSHFITAWRAI